MADDVVRRQKRLKFQPIEIVVSEARSMRWQGHVARISDNKYTQNCNREA
jgi:hypothetical protein